MATFAAAQSSTQTSQVLIQRIDTLRTQIKTAEQQHANAAEVGGMWVQLANRYQDQIEFAQAEDAFARSLRLLRSPDTQAAYADALAGMGSLYIEMGRLHDGAEYSRQSLAIYTTLGDGLHTATLHDTMALSLLLEHRYRESEVESAEGMTEMQALAKPDAGELITAYLLHSYAICNQGRCSEALGDVDRAMLMVESHEGPDSIEMAGVWLARGYDQWKAGTPDDADRAMGAALHILRGCTKLPQPLLDHLQLGVMRQYDAFLKGTHRKPQAKQLETEMARLEARQPQVCGDCTVSVAALGLMP
jgi:tetratricopeptide (TPR) repeat protein